MADTPGHFLSRFVIWDSVHRMRTLMPLTLSRHRMTEFGGNVAFYDHSELMYQALI